MLSLAERGANPSVVDDQFGRLTFASELARAIRHLADTGAPYGLYNLTGSGPVGSRADIARKVYELAGHDPNRVVRVSTDEHVASITGPVALRPRNSVLDLSKIRAAGFLTVDAHESLVGYIQHELSSTSRVRD
jgi:dTDP-4-dehydrorhamnose 3,5-epimerase